MIAIIGGSQAHRLLEAGGLQTTRTRTVKTPFGPSQPIHDVASDTGAFLFMSRHGEGGYHIAAPFVNYRANVYALKELGVERIVAWSGPGTIDTAFEPGQYVVPHDVLDETKRRESTFFTGTGLGFIRMRTPFCPTLRGALVNASAAIDHPCADGAVYVCTEGPRIETAAEIRKYELCGGQLVGMTLCPEAFLARELEMCYAAICFVTNYAEGIVDRPQDPSTLFEGLATPDERDAANDAARRFPELMEALLHSFKDMATDCTCQKAMQRFRERGDIGEDWHTWIGEA
jgi:5'-methylthioinosine phosphorylase